MQSNLSSKLHVAIIMDGNGRWAARQGLPRHAGHKAGVDALRRVVEAAPALGIGTLTVYAFSVDNWRRPEGEVTALLGLLRRYLQIETPHLVQNGVRLSVIGRRDRLGDGVGTSVEHAEAETARGRMLHLRIAFDYSARDSILRAAAKAKGPSDLTQEAFSRLLTGELACRDVDLLIRTSGEQRLSDFLLWECAYAELHFTDRLWPDFGAGDLNRALQDFYRRDRRFGGLSEKSEKEKTTTTMPEPISIRLAAPPSE